MTAEKIDVAVIGAGTAGLSARGEIAKVTDSYRVFDPGPLGTLCARSACMPSKAFLQSAHDFHRRHAYAALGIEGADHLRADTARVLARTRALRDDMVRGVVEKMEAWREAHLVQESAHFEGEGVLRAGAARFRPRATVIATGSRPNVPEAWREEFGTRILTSDDIFELDDLPARMAVLGLGPVGLELGQALARLGVEVTAFDPRPQLGGMSHPDLCGTLRNMLAHEMRIVTAEAEPFAGRDRAVAVRWEDGAVEVDAVLVAMGRVPALEGLGLETLDPRLSAGEKPDLAPGQLNLQGTRLYFTGDAGAGPPLLHEAADEGRIAGYHAARHEDARFRRRVPLSIVFSDPQIAVAGRGWDDVKGDPGIATAGADVSGSGRNRLQRGSGGALRLHARRTDARLVGAEILAAGAEHMGHLLAHAIDGGATVGDLLAMPFYHPTGEEVLRRALRGLARDCAIDMDEIEAIRCDDTPVDGPAAG